MDRYSSSVRVRTPRKYVLRPRPRRVCTYLVDLHVGLPVDDAVKVTGAQAVGLLEPPVLGAMAAGRGQPMVRIRRQSRRHGHAHRLLFLGQLVQIGQRAHRGRASRLDNRPCNGRRERGHITRALRCWSSSLLLLVVDNYRSVSAATNAHTTATT